MSFKLNNLYCDTCLCGCYDFIIHCPIHVCMPEMLAQCVSFPNLNLVRSHSVRQREVFLSASSATSLGQ